MRSEVRTFGNADDNAHSHFHREGNKLHVTTIEYKDSHPKELTPAIRIPPGYNHLGLIRLSTLVTVECVPEVEVFGVTIKEQHKVKTVVVWAVDQFN